MSHQIRACAAGEASISLPNVLFSIKLGLQTRALRVWEGPGQKAGDGTRLTGRWPEPAGIGAGEGPLGSLTGAAHQEREEGESP